MESRNVEKYDTSEDDQNMVRRMKLNLGRYKHLGEVVTPS